MILVVGATAPEVAWASERAACGVGPVEAAIATARLLAERRPRALLHVGIAGARRSSGIPIGAIAVGTLAVYEDLAARFPGLVRTAAPDAGLLARVRDALPAAHAVEIGTSAAVGGTAASPVEAMEGFAVLRAAALAGVPAVELRAISNHVEEADRSRWDIPGALAALAFAGAAALAALEV